MLNKYKTWLWKTKAERCVSNLKKHKFNAVYAESSDAALKMVLEITDQAETIGFGGSATADDLGIKETLRSKGKTIYDHNEEGLPPEKALEYRKKQGSCDCFICSANGVSETGEIVNVDGIGNRTNAMSFGPEKVIIIAGVNKLAPDLESAIRRVREVAAPMRAKSLGMDTPCAETGTCIDCNSPMRICNITAILHRKPMLTDISVVLVNQELGF